MDDVSWRRITALFAAALEREPAERAALLAAAEPKLRAEVDSLLAAHEAIGPLDRLGGHIDSLLAVAWASTVGGLGAVRERATSVEPGQRLGRHEIRGRLGAGGMGEVYRALDTRLQREVAVKVLSRRLLARPGSLQRFEQEARAASALNHPNIVTVYDIGEESSFPYIVMELVEGESLRQVLSEPLPLERLLFLATQIADGLVAAHERRIVHGDLKPENILVNREGVAKIVDFGLARFRLDPEPTVAGAADTPEHPPEVGTLQGTPGYLAPEVVTGEAMDPRSDQFSFGAILYEMATGARAFPGRTPLEMLARSLGAEPRPLSEVRPDLPAPIANAVARCLRKAPAERYPATRELLEELRALRRGGGPPRPARQRPAAALPAQRTRLIGRGRELAAIERLVVDGDVRLITLTGAGGTGKTRLALEAAATLSAYFPGGVIFVPLAPIADPALVASAIAQATGTVVAASRPALAEVIADLKSGGARTLLVLDNFEQVIDAAPALSEILAACPDVTVMVTSRAVLHLYGEHGFPVPPLELPDPAQVARPESLADCPAVALFVERARAASAGFHLTPDNAATVAALCAGLDGLPLALELAAAQTRMLPPEAMLARLTNRLRLLTGGARDLPDRQQTLRRTIDWSHQLLSATQQAVFRRLAVFAGGFTPEAAQAVVDPYGGLDLSLEQGIQALVDSSLLEVGETQNGEPRFLILETLREYALEKLVENGEDESARQAHAAFFLVLAEEGSLAMVSLDRALWLRRFETEHDNFRAALDWLLRRGNADWGLRVAVALFHFWERGEHLAEGRRRLEALIELDAARGLPALQARALFAAGVLASTQCDVERGMEFHRRCLELYRELGDPGGIVVAEVALGNQHVGAGDYETGRVILEQSLALWEELGDGAGYARSLANLAFVARAQGRFADARALYRRAAALFEGLGDPLSRAWALDHEGDVAREQDELGAAELLYGEALTTFRALDDSWGIGSALADLGAIARQRADHDGARRLYREALASFARVGHRRGVVRLLEALACLAADEDRAERGIRLAAAAAVLRERVGAPPSPAVRGELERSLCTMQERLGAEPARFAWRDGAAMSVEEAIRLATADDRPS